MSYPQAYSRGIGSCSKRYQNQSLVFRFGRVFIHPVCSPWGKESGRVVEGGIPNRLL